MKKFFLIAVISMLAVILTNPAQEANAYVNVGENLSIGGILQGRWNYHLWEDDPEADFTLNRARLLIKGMVKENVKWFIQTEMGDVLDVKFIYYCPFAMTTFTMGRFLPAFTYFMPLHTGKLQMVNYPLITQTSAMWRQIGVQTSTMFGGGMFDLNLGIFNGATGLVADPAVPGGMVPGYVGNSWADELDDGKDLLARLNLNMGDIQAGGYYWHINMIGGEENDLGGNRMGFFGRYSGMGLNIIAEYLMRKDEIIDVDDTEEDAAGYYAHLGYKFMEEKLEALVRYDAWDPCTDLDDDEINWITFGLNYYLSGLNSMFYFNYIMKGEADPNEFDNDMIVLQYQILF
jgi:hypothetical protein